MDQDETSKRNVPSFSHSISRSGVDAFVPWVLSPANTGDESTGEADRKVFNRYYHFFAAGELRQLACDAAKDLSLIVGPPSTKRGRQGLEIVRDDYEKSNWYIELKLWAVM